MFDKRRVLEALRALIRERLAELLAVHAKAHSGAIHEENRAEHSKDTRATEASYLARGLAERVADLERESAVLASLTLREFTPDDPIDVTALVGVEDEASVPSTLFLVPAGGGEKLTIDGSSIRTITPTSPVGRALFGRNVGDEVALELPGGRVQSTIRWIR